jgi:lysophospholipase L1-like esterase
MRNKIIQITTSAGLAPYSLLLIVTFIIAMKQAPSKNMAVGKNHSFLALGDSYTIGERVNPGDNFPSQVVTLLNEKGMSFDPPEVVAQTGWTTDELSAAIGRSKLHDHYDFVTLLIGVNNQYRGRKVGDYIPEFESLLKRAVQFAGNNASHVIVLSIPDWGVTPFAAGRDKKQIAMEIDGYNSANEEIAKKYNVQYINITASTREALTDTSLLAPDGLHPSSKEYSKWAQEVAQAIQTKL